MEVTVVSLLKDGDRVIGCLAYEREHGRFRIFKAKAVILATGGVGRAYKITCKQLGRDGRRPRSRIRRREQS